MKIRLVTVIWGGTFVDAFLRLTLRTLVADGNLVDLAKAHRVTYTIYTTKEDAERIGASPLFRHLRSVVDVGFSLFTELEIDPTNFGSHGDLWARGLELARRNEEILFFIIPDCLYAKHTLMSWARQLDEGYRAIYSPGPQVVLETILSELESRSPDSDAKLDLDSKDIEELFFRHLHPIPVTMSRNSRRRIGHAEYDMRFVPKRGVAIRVLSSHPFCIDPCYFTNLRSIHPEDHVDRLAFAPVSVLSAEPLMKHVGWYYRPWSLDDMRITQLGPWSSSFSPPGCVAEMQHVYTVCLEQDAVWEAGLRRARRAGQFFVGQVRAAAAISQIFLVLARHGLSRSAQLLATATFACRLRRSLALRGNETILVPHDDAVRALGQPWFRSLLQPHRRRDLLECVQDHIVVAGGGPADWRTLKGKAVDEHVRVLDGPIPVSGFTLYVVDRVLWRNASRAVAPSIGDRAILAARALLTAAISEVAREVGALRRTLHALIAPGFALARRAASILERIPALGGLARHVQQAVAALEAIASGDRLRAPKATVTPPDADLLRSVRIVRGLQCAEEVLEYYEQSALPQHVKSAPLMLARDLLDRDSKSQGALNAQLEGILLGLCERYPKWAEANMELGFLLMDVGRTEEGLVALERATGGIVMTDARGPDPRAMAAAERARALAAIGELDGASKAFHLSLKLFGSQNDLRGEYGMHLYRLGRSREIAGQLARAMNAAQPAWAFPNAGRDARTLRHQLMPVASARGEHGSACVGRLAGEPVVAQE